MRVNGHNDQCRCAECGAIGESQPHGGAAPERLEINLDQKFDTSAERHPIWGIPGVVGASRECALPPEVRGARVVGAIELEHAGPTGRIVAVKLAVLDRDRITLWALWWDRETSTMVARPMRNDPDKPSAFTSEG